MSLSIVVNASISTVVGAEPLYALMHQDSSAAEQASKGKKDKVVRYNDITVYGATKRAEKITEAPAAVSTATKQDLERAARHGILARTLQGFTGVDIMQSGATDFVVNTRGFNNGLNRRVLVLQDGRDAAMPLLGAQEWNSFTFPIDDFARIEFVRGPAAALYGANAFNGVLNMVSYAPREVLGTKVSLLAGDYQTIRGDIRHAGAIGERWSYKISLGHSRTRNFATRRDSVQFLEYPGLVLERRPLLDDERNTFATYGSARLDYELSSNERLTAEAGYSRSGNEIYVFGLGRTLVRDVERPFARVSYNSPQWNVQAHWMSRYVPDTMRLMAVAPLPAIQTPEGSRLGNTLLDDSRDMMIDAQHNFAPAENISVVAGASAQLQLIRTKITTTSRDVDAWFAGLYGQFEWKASPLVKLVASARVDATNIHATQLSPRVAVVYAPISEHQFRLSAGRSFQRANYQELFRSTPAPPPTQRLPNGTIVPINFAALERALLDSLALWSGVRPTIELGLARVTPRALGNERLDVEKNLSAEVGYKGIFGDNLFVTVDAYYSRVSDFITSFLPGINPQYPTWKPQLPSALAPFQERLNTIINNTLGSNAVGLTLVNGVPTYVQSNANIGTIDQYGVDIGLNYYLTSNLQLGANASWYGFRVVENNTPSQPIFPNTSPLRANASITYTEPSFYDVTLQISHVQGFQWLAGVFLGYVPEYTIVNLSGGVQVLSNLRLGFNVFNLLDRQHFQIFGGTYLPRMATVKIDYTF
jgi:iron complex outermembrane receptor protein